ncbi:MAG: alpha/beta fold hydrolase [Thermodesulfobacteriota bacterium]
MREGRVLIPSGAIQLEGLLSIQETLHIKGGVILCHPHPKHGGNMYHPVITAAVEAASEEGFSTLRFNFRGVGESEGSYGEGTGEKEDVKATIDYFCSRLKDSHPSLILLGYSFGAWTGLSVAAEDGRIHGLAGIAPPLELYDFRFLGKCKKRKLFVAGNQDLFCSTPVLETWFQLLEEPKSLAIIPGADHFFYSHTRLLIQPIREFLSKF